MISPPKSCPKRFLGTEGLCTWVDIAMCNFYCPKSEGCLRYQRWKALTPEQRKEQLKQKGVRHV